LVIPIAGTASEHGYHGQGYDAEDNPESIFNMFWERYFFHLFLIVQLLVFDMVTVENVQITLGFPIGPTF
jgi:hypothetical protein